MTTANNEFLTVYANQTPGSRAVISGRHGLKVRVGPTGWDKIETRLPGQGWKKTPLNSSRFDLDDIEGSLEQMYLIATGTWG